MNEYDLKMVMAREPLLTDVGFWPYDDLRKIPTVTPESFAESRQSLLKQPKECQLVCVWLRQVQPIQSINWSVSSEGWRSLAERDIDYIGAGVFIAAALHLQFTYARRPGQRAAWFGMSKRSYEMLLTRKPALN